jgi:hypothetical protein
MWSEVLSRYEVLLNGAASREEVAAWARSTDPRSISFSGAPDPGLGFEAFASLRAVATRAETVLAVHQPAAASPYFIRESDLREWSRLLNVASLSPEFILTENVIALSGVVRNPALPSTLRGVDGLDYFEAWDIVISSGSHAMLQHHAGTPANLTAVHLELGRRTPADAVQDILLTLDCGADRVTWWSDRFF